MKSTHRWFVALFILCTALAMPAHAQNGRDNPLTKLPQDHDYQRVLRQFMASLTAKDFEHGVKDLMPFDKPYDTDPEYLYRHYIARLMYQPLVGHRRGTPAVTAPPELFILSAIETPQGVMRPPVWPETLMALVEFDYAGNLYHNNRALKLRSFVTATVQMIMFHHFAELNDAKQPPPIRPDWHGYNPIFWAAPYPGFKDVLPPQVQKAFEAGMKMAGERILSWGVRGESCENDLLAPLGLVYISRAVNDAEFTKKVEERTRMLCTDPRYFHPAGYWVERGGLDTGFAGQANLYSSWIALITDWAFVRDTVERVYRLRGHLILPEPDGGLTGPSHFNSRLGSPAFADQFDLSGARDLGASMITDEAAMFVPTATREELETAPVRWAKHFQMQIGQNPRVEGRYIEDVEITSIPWTLRRWMTYNYPVSVNPAYQFYRKGAFAHRQKLEKENSPLLKLPFLRGETFVRNFGNAFVITRQPNFAAIFHTGPVGVQSADNNLAQFGGPLGLGGGQVSAFWTPAGGSLILGLRSGMSYDQSYDQFDAWRTWPMHAVSGVTTEGTVFSSARIVKPEVNIETRRNTATVTAAGVLSAFHIVPNPDSDGQKQMEFCYDAPLDGRLDYARTFTIDDKAVSVETTVTGDGKDVLVELYEVVPVHLRRHKSEPDEVSTTIDFQVDGKWIPATEQYSEKVQAVKLTRFGGAVLVKFDMPQRLKLSPSEWQGTWLNGSACRNVMIDMLDNNDKPTALTVTKKVAYRIEPVAK